MNTDTRDTTIGDLHRIRREIAARFAGDVFAINADARARTEASGRRIIRCSQASNKVMDPSGQSGGNKRAGCSWQPPSQLGLRYPSTVASTEGPTGVLVVRFAHFARLSSCSRRLTMNDDPIVASVRKVREEPAAAFDYGKSKVPRTVVLFLAGLGPSVLSMTGSHRSERHVTAWLPGRKFGRNRFCGHHDIGSPHRWAFQANDAIRPNVRPPQLLGNRGRGYNSMMPTGKRNRKRA